MAQEPKGAAKQMPEVLPGETMSEFMTRCHADPEMLATHPNAADRRTACETIWADDSGDTGDMMQDGMEPQLLRAYSILHVKGINDGARVIEGTATTPSVDRIGDTINPLGIKFKNPLPCLLYHDSTKPVGKMFFAESTASGVKFRAVIPNVVEPGVLRDRVEEAWHSVRYGLLAGASIGFRTLGRDSYERMDGGGTHFKEVEVLETSLVCIPANADCTIDLVRSLDTKSVAPPPKPARPAVPVVHFSDKAERLRIIGRPHSSAEGDRRHSVKILTQR